jgi:hypothetical protein
MRHPGMADMLLLATACALPACAQDADRGGSSAAGLVAAPAQSASEPGVGASGLQSLELVQADPEFAGRHRPGRVATRRLTFRNRLDVPVRVEMLGKTCGCLAATIDPETVPAGGTASFRLDGIVPGQMGEQSHSASFRCTWVKDGAKHAERGRVGLRYMADIDVEVFPAEVALAGVLGREAGLHVVVRSLSGAEGPPELPGARCTIPGWRVEEVDEPRVGRLARMFRVRGPVASLSTVDGEVIFATKNPAQPEVRASIRLNGHTPWRAFPGGATFVGGRLMAEEREVSLSPRCAAAGEPARVEVEPVSAFVQAELAPGPVLRVRLRPGEGLEPQGSVRARVVGPGGELLAEVPVVWWTLKAPAESR